MDTAYRLDRLSADGALLIAAAASDLSATVPACADWTTSDLLGHVGWVWRMVAHSLEHLPTGPGDRPRIPEAPPGDEVVDYARTGLDQLLPVIRGVDPKAELWALGAPRQAAFFIRRVHLETLVHRVDAEGAAGTPSAIASDDAADAVDELGSIAFGGDSVANGSLHLHQTDGDGEWMLDVIDGKAEVRREHAKGDCAVRGTAADLMMVMWGRRSLDGLELFGDRSIAEEWIKLAP